jgi:hypothetical protein
MQNIEVKDIFPDNSVVDRNKQANSIKVRTSQQIFITFYLESLKAL